MKKPEKINNLQSLRYEQERLKSELVRTEGQLEESWDYLKDHYKRMIWQQVNPFKNSSLLNLALDVLQPGLLPVVTELVKGGVKGNPLNLKVLGSSAKYAAATLGIKWLRRFLDKKETDENQSKQAATPEQDLTE